MNTSFELLSTMSPKVNKEQKPSRKPPTKLALKKNIRKSLSMHNSNHSPINDSIITIGSSSICSSSVSSKNKNVNTTPIIISDSETSFNNEKTPSKSCASAVKVNEILENICDSDTNSESSTDNGDIKKSCEMPSTDRNEKRLSKEKYTNIEQWVDEVNRAKHNFSLFSEVSAISGVHKPSFIKSEIKNGIANSTLKKDAKRFHQLFKNTDSDYNTSRENGESNKNSDMLFINDSLENDDIDLQNSFKNMSIDDYLQVNETDLSSRIQKKKSKDISEPVKKVEDNNTSQNLCEYENLLDTLYGNSWRERKEEILPSSEPRPKKIQTKTNIPNSERRIPNVSNFNTHEPDLLRILQKARFKQALESPWTKVLKNVCDSDNESDYSGNRALPHTKLNFEDDNSVCSDSGSSQDSVHIIKTVSKKVKNKTKKIHSEEPTNTSKNYSFLASLSGNIPPERSDTSALIFRNNFKQNKEKLSLKLFNLYNDKVFENSIPKDTPIDWSDRMVRTAGTCICKKVTRRTGAVERTIKLNLSNKVVDSADRLRDTLIHEMCHAATWVINKISDGHGSFWKSWAHRAMKTFPELPPIKTCHNYVISTKYTYKCTGCGYSVGRHTKSLDVQRKRCGYCYGTFEVLINKTTKKGETKAVPATPKKLSGFALFVKENYADVKRPELKHADVMKMLSQKFATLKVDQS